MNRAEKRDVVAGLTTKFNTNNMFYLTDASGMSVEDVNNLRRKCFSAGIQMKVAKNSLIEKAFDASEVDFEEMKQLLKGPTAIMFTETANLPAKLIKEFRGDNKKPMLKGAFIDSSVYVGDEMLQDLASLKSKEELIGEVILLLQSPIKNVVSALQSSSQTIAGLVKTLENRGGAE